MLHLDTKKLVCFAQPGYRVTGDRTRCTRRAGSQALHVAIDEHSRVGFGLLLPDETARSACQHLLQALRYYKALGVRVEQVMTDNGSAYQSRRFARLLRCLKITHPRTRHYTPRTNGKAERFIETLLKEWAYAYCYPRSDHRANALAPWMYHGNFHRPHSATPVTCLTLRAWALTGTTWGETTPSYGPELNPGERLSADLKRAIGAKVSAQTKAKLHAAASEHMQLIQANPQRVRAYFQDPIVRYAA